MMKKNMLDRYIFLFSLLIAVLLGGCAVSPKTEEAAETGPVFYPPLPDAPRIQYLASYSGPMDLVTQEKSKFAEFVLGKEQEAQRVINKPYGIALHENKLYVVDTRGNGYVIFDLIQNQFRTVHGMLKPINITIDRDGTKYVTDTELEQILVFDTDDKRIKTFRGQGIYKPGDVAIINNKLYVTDLTNHQVIVLDKATGQKIYTIASAGSAEGQLFHPTNLAVAKNGNLLVSDTSNFRVVEFTPDGRYVRQLGEIGTSFGKFARPKGVAVDQEGLIYVVDAAFENVQVFSSNGQLLVFFGGPGTGPGQMYLPTDIYIDYTSAAYFQQYAEPGFNLEYVILVANQFGPNKVNVYGFGKMADKAYP
jgi:DNA-binding beta-propeller fold protein YncE